MSSRLHFVARPGRSEELAEHLRRQGFDTVKVLPREHVLLEAPSEQIRERLGLSFEETGEPRPMPEVLARLVERVYRPKPPERLGRGQ